MYRPPLESIICGVSRRPDVNTSHLYRMAESREEGREKDKNVVGHSLRRPTSTRSSLFLTSRTSLGQLVCFSSTI